MKKIIYTLLFWIGLLSTSYSQIAMGEFRAHLMGFRFYDIAVTPDYIYGATDNHLAIIDKKNGNTISSWSKVDGLSEIGISKITYDSHTELLIIAYKNSNIDLISPDGTLYNVNDIKNKSISGSKQINDIYVSQSTAYLACDFGVVILNLQTHLIQDTWFTTLNGRSYKVQDLTLHNGIYYLTTDEGIFYTPNNNPRIADFSTWEQIIELEGLFFNHIVSFHDYIIANKYSHREGPDSLYICENGNWRYAPELFAYYVGSLTTQGEELLICDWEKVHIYDKNLSNKDHFQWQMGLVLQGKAAQFDGSEYIWIADSDFGIYRIDRKDHSSKNFKLQGPRTNHIGAIACYGDKTAIISGSQERYGYSYFPSSLGVFANEQWSFNYPSFNEFQTPWDLKNVIFHPQKPNEIYIASWMGGLFHLVNNEIVKQFMPDNSPLEGYYNNYTSVSGLAFDHANNLWITNSKVSNLIKVYKNDGKWLNIRLPYVSGEEGVVAEQLLIDKYNYKWITFPRSNQLLVYHDNNSLDNLQDDIAKLVNLNSAANVSTQIVNCIAEDKDGNIWIGTDQGIKVVYNNAELLKNGMIYAKNILITQNGYTQNLLEHESINCIAIDGANRKWVGTSRAGLFLISENGNEEIAHFDENNSPLFSNQINALKVNPITGELFIATSMGLMGYHTDATEGKETFSQLKVFPNPVRADYNGLITITGLMENAFCKITDAQGQLVWQGYAKGGTLTWNGKNFYGIRPATGVYFVMASDESGKKKATAKILLIK